MRKRAPITEPWQPFVENLQESFWGEVSGKTRRAWKQFREEDSRRQRDRWVGLERYERGERGDREYRHGF